MRGSLISPDRVEYEHGTMLMECIFMRKLL
jgi:hypothetical protein